MIHGDQTKMNYKKSIDNLLSQYQHISKTIKDEKEYLTQAKQDVTNTEIAQKILMTLSEEIQNKVHSEISKVVSECLKAVFENSYTFKVIFEKRRGKTEARLTFIRDGNELDPLSEAGGGCTDIASLALRLACLVLTRPQRRRVLILDEPFKGISPDYRPLVPKLIETLAEKMQCQFIFVTNITDYICGKVINLNELN